MSYQLPAVNAANDILSRSWWLRQHHNCVQQSTLRTTVTVVVVVVVEHCAAAAAAASRGSPRLRRVTAGLLRAGDEEAAAARPGVRLSTVLLLGRLLLAALLVYAGHSQVSTQDTVDDCSSMVVNYKWHYSDLQLAAIIKACSFPHDP